MRLDRLLGALALGTRSETQRLIRRGEISVNGLPVRDPGAAVDPARDRVSRLGEELDIRLERHILLDKPAGLLTAARDSRQPTVMGLLPPVLASLGCMPVGRLDKDTTGLLLLTTDGELNHRLLSPARHVDKTYDAEVDGPLGEAERAAFARGIEAGDFKALPAELRVLRCGPDAAEALVTVREGQFHQIKRMFAAVGREVLRLRRTAFGPLRLDGDSVPGTWRELTPEELGALRRAVQMEEA